tara:strand:+ start:1370 stop:1702 length:333 start_codon:yes stop_codon:yes gene_type:complete
MITITSTETAKILIKGTKIELTSVIARVGGTITFGGKTLPTVLEIFEDLEAFELDPTNTIDISGFDLSKVFDLSNGDTPETWKDQTIQVAHNEYKAYLESLNFTAVITGI